MAKVHAVPEYLKEKACHCPKHHGEIIPISEFSLNPQGADGLNTMCKWGRNRERLLREGKPDPLGEPQPVSETELRYAVAKLGPEYSAALEKLCPASS